MILKPPVSSVALDILNIHIHWYGIIMALSIFTGIIFSCYFFRKYFKLDDYNIFVDISPYIVFFAIVGARIFYVLGNWDFYSKNINEIIMINHGGISIYGAIIFGLISIFIFSKIKKFDALKFCDVIAVSFPLCQAIGRWGNFINQEAYGVPFEGFLKMYIDPIHRIHDYTTFEYYHPAFLYESILDVFLFAILFFVFLKFKNLKPGTILLTYLFLYSIIRIIVESIRIDSVCFVFGIPVAMFISIFVALISGFILIYRRV